MSHDWLLFMKSESNPAAEMKMVAPGTVTAENKLMNRSPLMRLAASGLNQIQMTLAEAYIHGFEIPDDLFKAAIHGSMPTLFRHFPGLLAPYEWVLKEGERVAESSEELMKIQYDLPQELFDAMLGHWEDLYPKYTTGFWEQGAQDLRESQLQMMDQLVERLEIEDGDHILDFGCGWGAACAFILSRFPNARVTGLNLSHRQCEYIRGEMKDPTSILSSDRFSLMEGDINNVEFSEKFDKILSVGVFEHVSNLTQALKDLSAILKDDGKVLIHMITVRLPNNMSSGFTHKYIFPHGRYWNHDAIPSHSQDLRTVSRWYMNGMNYHRTLSAWLERFDAAQDLLRDLNYGMPYPRFRRMWRFYLLLLGTIFSVCDGHYNGNGQYLMVKA